jgi:hypothetical protein
MACERQFIFACWSNKADGLPGRCAISHSPSLADPAAITKIHVLDTYATAGRRVDIVRITETINGRTLLIEVSAVGQSRWRAQIACNPGGITALMPFYGPTPDAAAQRLASWLERAGRTVGSKPRPEAPES